MIESVVTDPVNPRATVGVQDLAKVELSSPSGKSGKKSGGDRMAEQAERRESEEVLVTAKEERREAWGPIMLPSSRCHASRVHVTCPTQEAIEGSKGKSRKAGS